MTYTRKYRENPLLLHRDLRWVKAIVLPKSTNLDDMTLEEQNANRRMENDILKTLRTLLKKWEESIFIKSLNNWKNAIPSPVYESIWVFLDHHINYDLAVGNLYISALTLTWKRLVQLGVSLYLLPSKEKICIFLSS